MKEGKMTKQENELNKVKITTRVIEKKIFIGYMDRKEKVVAYCKENNFRIIHSGHNPVGLLQYNTKQFKIIAERAYNHDKN